LYSLHAKKIFDCGPAAVRTGLPPEGDDELRHPDRDAQFRSINEQAELAALAAETGLGDHRVPRPARHLPDQHGHRIEPVTALPHLPAHVPTYVPRTDGDLENKVKEAC
jgi:hypothetical protein